MRLFGFLKSFFPKVPEVTQRRGFLAGIGALVCAPFLPKIPLLSQSQYDPVIISLVRRAMPNIIAYELCNVQPMTGPTGKVFTFPNRPVYPTKPAIFKEE